MHTDTLNPALAAAKAQIEAVLHEHDLAAHVVLHAAPGDLQFFGRLDPSYSRISCHVDEHGIDHVRLFSSLAHYGGDAAAQARDLAATANMVRGFAQLLAQAADHYAALANWVDGHVGATHGALQPVAAVAPTTH